MYDWYRVWSSIGMGLSSVVVLLNSSRLNGAYSANMLGWKTLIPGPPHDVDVLGKGML
jgi:hypothetical protein